MRPRRRSLAASLAVCCALLGQGASARAEGSDPVAAEQLFEAGRAAMDRKDYPLACQRFAESERLDPAAGTLINLAECYDRQGLVASSWQRWKEALDVLRPGDERREAVERRVAATVARLPKLELRLADGAPKDSAIARDGLTLGSASLGLALPVDPGAHRVVVTAPGHRAREYPVTIAEAESQTLTVEPGAMDAAAPVTSSAPAASGLVASSRRAESPALSPAGPNSARTWGFVAVSAGAAALVVGGVSGALALSRKHTMDDDCSHANGTLYCGQKGIDAASSGRTFATLANVGVAVGVVGIGVGSYLLLSRSGDGSRTTLSARGTASGASVGLTRTF